jgi:hypothetical protein
MLVVVVADDLGFCATRDAGIFAACAPRGVVHAASVLVAGASAPAAVARGEFEPRRAGGRAWITTDRSGHRPGAWALAGAAFKSDGGPGGAAGSRDS